MDAWRTISQSLCSSLLDFACNRVDNLAINNRAIKLNVPVYQMGK
jgi:hypothetical protein